MPPTSEQCLLRVWLSSTARTGWFSGPAAENVLLCARDRKLGGATLYRGIHGLGPEGELLGENSPWSLTEHLPVIVEIIAEGAAIGAFLAELPGLIPHGLATLERAHVLTYRHATQTAVAVPRSLPAGIAPLSTLPHPEEFPAMKESDAGQLVRIFIGEADVWEGQPLYRAIVLEARRLGLAGATVLRAAMGFGANSRVHTTRLLELSTDMPLVVEIVDTPEQVAQLLPFLDQVVAEGLITIEEVRVLRYRHNPAKKRP